MENKNLLEVAKWIEATKQGIRKRDVKIIQNIPSLSLAYSTIVGMQAGVYEHAPLTSVCATIGRLVTLPYETPEMTTEKINVSRVNVGYHLLNTFFDNNKMKIREGRKRGDAHTLAVIDDDFIDSLLYSVNVDPLDLKLHSRPIFGEPLQFEKFNHPILGELVRKCNPEVRKEFTYDKTPVVFDVINKHMRTGYKINQDVLKTINLCKKEDIYTFKSKDLEPDARVGIKREQTGVLDMATSIKKEIFYQGMFYDFRGRLYSSLSYLSPQGSDMSKSLFYLSNKKPLRAEGWFWLLVHASNCWGEDKLSLDDGYTFAEDRLDEWMVWAEDPINNKGWHEADNYWGFLAAIKEIYKAVNHPTGKEAFESGLMIAWDATCSGLQVLAALTRDEKSGKLCNLTGEERGDYYQMISDEVWKDCKYTEDDIKVANGVSFDLNRLGRDIENASSRTAKKKAIEEIKLFMSENRDDIRIATKVFWGRPEMAKLRRKIVKRPCMTYFYSCQPKTMSLQLFNDFKSEPEFKGLQMSYCYWICNRIYKACRENMPIATRMMDALIDMGKADFDRKNEYLFNGKPTSLSNISKKLNITVSEVENLIITKDDRFEINPKYVKGGMDFTITGPYNGFKLMQYYRSPITKKVKMSYKKGFIQLNVFIGQNDKVKYRKVLSATSPNVVHMLDSQIVASVIMNADYDITCIHDSFSTCPVDAGKLYEDTRKCFVDLFDEGLLERILEEKEFETSISLGTLDINDVLDNQYFVK